MPAQYTLILCERNADWVVPLRWPFRALPESANRSGADSWPPLIAGVDYRLVETRTPDDCLAALAVEPQAVVGVELTAANCDPALALVRTIAEQFPRAPMVLLAARETAEYQWLARELGAAGFVTSPRRLAEFLTIARRHWDALPRPEAGAAESAWATLPWK